MKCDFTENNAINICEACRHKVIVRNGIAKVLKEF